ncbi:MAG: transketolase, partial [Mesorhizobium sp.]
MDDIGDQGEVSALLERRTDEELGAVMENLGGHCPSSLTDGFNAIDHDRPTVFIVYTIKGWGTPLAGHKDNHAGLMTEPQMKVFKKRMNIRDGHEWDPGEGLHMDGKALKAFIAGTPFFAAGRRRHGTTPVALVPDAVPTPARPCEITSTQTAFGKILD